MSDEAPLGVPRSLSLGILVAVAGAALAAMALSAWGGVRLPAPPGPYAVGTTLWTLEPTSSALQIWYPAAGVSAARRAPYELGAHAPKLRNRVLAAFVRTDSYVDAPCRSGTFPVVLYVPGWGGLHNDNTALAQAFASAGFIVVAVDDRYPARPLDFDSERAYTRTVRWAEKKVALQAGVMRAVLDALPRLANAERGGLLADRLDLSRVGIFGFSFGGAVAAEAARSDPRVKAAANLDGWLFDRAATDGVPRPFLMLSGLSGPAGSRYQAQFDVLDEAQMRAGLRRYGGYLLSIRGADHYNFADVAFFPTFRHTGLGPIESSRAGRIVRDYIVQFFDHYLKAGPAPLFEPAAADAPGGGPRRQFDDAAQLQIWPRPGDGNRTGAGGPRT